MAVMACAVTCMVSCGPKHEEFRPQLEVLLPSGGSLADGSVNYDAGGGATDFVVRSNGGWSITGGTSWLEISPSSGTGDGAVRISAAAAESSRSAVVEVSMTQAPQVRISFNVVQRVEETEPEDPEEPDDPLQGIIYRDSFDGAEARAEYGRRVTRGPRLPRFPAVRPLRAEALTGYVTGPTACRSAATWHRCRTVMPGLRGAITCCLAVAP